jgi:hypothetical protein
VFQPSRAEAYSLYPYYIPLQSPSIINDSLHTLYDYKSYIRYFTTYTSDSLVDSRFRIPFLCQSTGVSQARTTTFLGNRHLPSSSKLDLLFARQHTTYNLRYRDARVKSDCECLKYPYPPNQSIYPDRQTIDPSNSTTLLYRLHPCRPSFYPNRYSRYLDRLVVIVPFVSLSQAS